MNQTNIRERFNNFRQLLEYNFLAINQLASIRLGLEQDKRFDAEAQFYKTVNSVEKMIELYGAMTLLPSTTAVVYQEKLKEISDYGSGAVVGAQSARRFGYDDSSIMQSTSERMFSAVENISEEIRDSSNKRFILENVKTVHDLIRYVHQKSIDKMFEAEKGEGGQTYSQGGAYFNLQNIGEGLTVNNKTVKRADISCKPLEVVLRELDNLQSPTAIINAVVDRSYLNAHLALGCHSADLAALLDDSGNFIELKYNESKGFVNSERRSFYLSECLQHLGFKVKSGKNQLIANFRDSDKETTSEALGGISRLLLTCKDLDLFGGLNTDEEVRYAVGYFQAGGTQPRRALQIKHTIDKVLASDLEFNQVLAQIEHSVKPSLKKERVSAIGYFKNLVEKRLNEKFPGHENLDVVVEQILTGEFITPKPERMLSSDLNPYLSAIENMADYLIKNDKLKYDKLENYTKLIYPIYKDKNIKTYESLKKIEKEMPSIPELEKIIIKPTSKLGEKIIGSLINKIDLVSYSSLAYLINKSEKAFIDKKCFCGSKKPFSKCCGKIN